MRNIKWGGYLLEPILMAVALGLFVALAPYITRTPRGEKELKLYMALTVLGYAAVLFAAYSFLAWYLGRVPSLWIFAFILTALGAVQYFIAPFLVNIMYRMEPASECCPEIEALVVKLARKSGLKPPKVMIVRASTPNAFTYGNFLTGRYVAITEGLLRSVSRDELEAVIGHELGHLKLSALNLLLLFAVPALVILLVLPVNDNIATLLTLALMLIFFSLERIQEYYADLHAAKLKGKRCVQRTLAKLYLKIEGLKNNPAYAMEIVQIRKSPAKTLFIYAFVGTPASPYYDLDSVVEKLKKERVNPIFEIFMCHPPISKRLKFLDTVEG